MDVADELRLLDDAFNETLYAMPEPCAELSDALLDRVNIRQHKARAWTARLAPLTLLYPLLQSEGLPEIDTADARRATLSHLFFLIHTFVEDRYMDGQLTLHPNEVAFMRRCLFTGFEVLDDLGADHRRWSTMLLRRSAQAHLGATPPVGPSIKGEAGWVKELASSRAGLGIVATLALAESRGCDPTTLRKIRNGFDCLITALQWTDDMADWQEDLDLGGPNLLLLTLQMQTDERFDACDAKRLADRLLSEKAFGNAAVQARRWLECALRREQSLQCQTLCEFVRRRLRRLDRLTGRAVRDAQELAGSTLPETTANMPERESISGARVI